MDQRGGGGGAHKGPPPPPPPPRTGPPPHNLSRRYCNDETWHFYTLPKEDAKKHMNHMRRPLSSE